MKKIILFLLLIFSIWMSAQTTVESVQVADMDEGAPHLWQVDRFAQAHSSGLQLR